VGVERVVAAGTQIRCDAFQALRVPASEDDLGALSAGKVGGGEADTGTAADDEHRLPSKAGSRTVAEMSVAVVMKRPPSDRSL